MFALYNDIVRPIVRVMFKASEGDLDPADVSRTRKKDDVPVLNNASRTITAFGR